MLLHILTKFHRPPVAVRYRRCLAGFLVLFDQLPHGVQEQFVSCSLASWVVASRSVFEINLLEEIVE